MIEVKKGPEPEDLKKLREECLAEKLTPKQSFEMLRNPLKKQVIEYLKRDQGQLCVYCMSRIPREDKDPGIPGETIEHFIPLEPEDGRDVGQGLDYQNLFAVCHGNMKFHKKGTQRTSSKKNLTCDKHRGNMEFWKINPCRRETLQSIIYTLDGKIDATDPDVKFDLVEVLNLNCDSSPIISERKAVLDALINDLNEVAGTDNEDDIHSYCMERLEAFTNEQDAKTPYVGILRWYLQSMITALA